MAGHRLLRATASAAAFSGLLLAPTAATAAPPKWENVPTPPLDGLAVLLEVAAAGPGAAWTTGVEDSAKPVMLAWNGRQWQRQALPPGLGGPTDLAAAGPRSAWGLYPYTEGSPAIHWDGTAWRKSGYPAGVKATQPSPLGSGLQLLSAAPGGPAWSLGYDTQAQKAVALRFQNGRWVRQSTPVSMTNASAIAVRSAKDIWIACTCDIPGSGPREDSLLRWDGTKWNTLRYPGKPDTYIAKIVPVSATSVWAYRASTRYQAPELMHWNGTRWTATTIPVPATPFIYHHPTLVDDGAGGVWTSVSTDGDDKSYLRYSGGRWIPESGEGRPTTSMYIRDLARVPGTRTIWATGHASSLTGPPFTERRS